MYEELERQYKLIFDPHTHTTYTHGTCGIFDIVEEANKKGLSWVGITEHGPGNFNYGLDLGDLELMRSEINDAKKAFPNVNVKLGIELNTKRSFPYVDIPKEIQSEFELILCGYHFSVLDAGMVENKAWSLLNKKLNYKRLESGEYQADISPLLIKNTTMMLNALDNNKIDILTHIGDKGPFDICDISKKCEETGTILEVNLKHGHLNVEELKIAKDYDVKFVISSDAHRKEDVGVFTPQLSALLEAGIELDRIINIEKK